MNSLSDNPILARLLQVGVGELPGDKLPDLAKYLEHRADSTGLAAPQLAADAIWEINHFLDEFSEGGGIRMNYISQIDSVLIPALTAIQREDPLASTVTARKLLAELRDLIKSYRP